MSNQTGFSTDCSNCGQTFPSINQYRRHLSCFDLPSYDTVTVTITPTPSVVCRPPKRGYWPTVILSDNTMMTVTVSDDANSTDKEDFVIPQEYLTAVSQYFENAFQGSFREAAEKKLHFLTELRDADGEDYVYQPEADAKQHELLEIYIFADVYDIPQLRRDILDAFILYQEESPSMCHQVTVEKAYASLPDGSPMLSFLVHAHALWTGNQLWKRDREQWVQHVSKEFLIDVMIKKLRTRK
ncbi:hypothetical protein EJ08DRAFT_732933 [Tothia fuscella]|uniref:BTB domain-containing protein n=1 Tax=Tothia fuscella TaxID=1048955 RepID=A0A9P4NUC7_9PEZI|nr:hypothetical protein EJ08DRAFT_732933 [Tothia fuscella]